MKELVPFINEEIVLGGFHTPSGRRGRLAPGRDADARGGHEARRARRVREHRGDGHRRRGRRGSGASARTAATIETEDVVVACGVWSPRIARMAGASIPLTPAVHQMIDVGPVPAVHGDGRRDRLPDHPRHGHEHVRAPARQRVGDRLVRPPADLRPPRRDPLERGGRALADRAAVHAEDFDQQLEQALELIPEILGDEASGSSTPSTGSSRSRPTACPLLGESPEVRGLWSAAAVWVKEAPGIGRTIAEWMTDGTPRSTHTPPTSPLLRVRQDEDHIHARAREGYNKTYGIVHPSEQWASNRTCG